MSRSRRSIAEQAALQIGSPARGSGTAEILTIGTELLLGEIADTNTRHIARTLRDHGVDVYRTQTVGDNPARIAAALSEAAKRADVVIMTGGLGPTVDDVTRDAVALAGGEELAFRPELWEQVVEHFRRYGREPTDNNRRQAELPTRARAIPNPVGTAPAFAYDLGGTAVYALPGVPSEMEYLLSTAVLPAIRAERGLTARLLTRVVRTAGVGESVVDTAIADLEELSNPTVGLAAHPGSVDVRITAKAGNDSEARAMIAEVEAAVVERLGTAVYGYDDETLEGSILNSLADSRMRLVTAEHGTRARLAARLEQAEAARQAQAEAARLAQAEAASAVATFAGGEVLGDPPRSPETLLANLAQTRAAEAAMLVVVESAAGVSEHATLAHVALLLPSGSSTASFAAGGHSDLASERAATLALNALRMRLLADGLEN